MKLQLYIKQLRPKNWLKNIFVFIPLTFATALKDIAKLGDTFVVFIAFCMVSSAVYTLNDIYDMDVDKNHPVKRNRPLASGAIEVTSAIIMSVTLMTLSLGLAFYINAMSGFIVMLYVAENLLYSTLLKHRPVYDCFCIATGFVLRIYAGSFAGELFVTDWLFLTIIAMSLFMAFGKRRGEMLKIDPSYQRAVLEHYDLAFLNGMMFVFAGLSIVFYALWAMVRGMYMIYTVPLVIFLVCKYLLLVHDDHSYGDPTTIIFSDKTLISVSALYVATTIYLLYTRSPL